MNDKILMKEIIEQRRLKGSTRKPKYATRKLSIGLVSCMLGFTLLVSPSDAWAEEATIVPMGTEEPVDIVPEAEEPVDIVPEAEEPVEIVPLAEEPIVDQPVEESIFSAEQKQKLKDAKFTDEEIKELEAKAKEEMIKEGAAFNLDTFVDQEILLRQNPDLDKNEETKAQAIGNTEDNKPAIATREAAEPEESEVGNDSRDAVHAFVGVQTGGDLNLPLAGATGQQFKPIEGVRAYFQWFEDGGYVSPVYTAVSDANGRLNIGAKPYIAGDGKLIQFDADPTVSAGHEKYRFWVDKTTIPEGYQLQYITGEQVIFPQGAATMTQGGSGSNTAKNTHENWKILLMQKPKVEMHRTDAKETPVQSKTGGYMTGTVSWDYTSGVGGVQWNTVADHSTPAPDVTVRASYLSDYAMKQIFSAETAKLMGVSDASKIRGR